MKTKQKKPKRKRYSKQAVDFIRNHMYLRPKQISNLMLKEPLLRLEWKQASPNKIREAKRYMKGGASKFKVERQKRRDRIAKMLQIGVGIEVFTN